MGNGIGRTKYRSGFDLKGEMAKVRSHPYDEKNVQKVYEDCITFRYKKNKDDDFFIEHKKLKGAECDGFVKNVYIDSSELRLLLEYKKCGLSEQDMLARALLQVVFYLKRFEDLSDDLPNAVLIGDSSFCFVLSPNPLRTYLYRENINWSIAPSKAPDVYPNLVDDLKHDMEIPYQGDKPRVCPVRFDLEHCIDDDIFSFVEELALGNSYKHITERSLSRAFDKFCRDVIIESEKISPNDLVALFVGLLTNPKEYVMEAVITTKAGKERRALSGNKNQYVRFVTPLNGSFRGNLHEFRRFFEEWHSEYTQEEKRMFTSVADRLIRNVERRRQGAFFTPDVFVHFAHKMLSEHLGSDWCENYVIWDCACGSKNLTRDLHCTPNLYCSTLLECELEMGERYNRNATSWVMDFLNDDDDVIPQSLIQAFEQNKPIVFFINPPYGKNTGNSRFSGIQTSVVDTKVHDMMCEERYGGSENLQHQFMYRITKIVETFNLTNAYFALFSNPIWITGAKQSVFLKNFTSRWECMDAYLFQASHFADVSDTWGISLTLWKVDKQAKPITERSMKLIDILDDGSIDVIGSHTLYNSNERLQANDWCRQPLKGKETFLGLPMSSGLCINENCKFHRGKKTRDAIGFMFNGSNNVGKNATEVSLMSETFAVGQGFSVTRENFNRCVTLFTARKLIACSWINAKDEYLAPNTEHPDYSRFEADSVVYSLFHSSSNQTSLRQITYKGKQYDIQNEFFWMSKEQIKELANKHSDEVCDFIYEDASSSKERYVYRLLFEEHWYDRLSPTAKAVLDMAMDMVRKSMPYRDEYESTYEERHLRAWDAGWYQLKEVCKKYLPDDFKQFSQLFKQLGDELRPLVYSVGFLSQ